MDDGPHRFALRLRSIVRIVALCAATLTLWPILDENDRGTPDERTRALALTPLVGLALGIVLALLDRALAFVLARGARSVAILAIGLVAMLGMPARGIADTAEALRRGLRLGPTGIARIGPVGVVAAVMTFALEAFALSTVAVPESRTGALVMSQMIGRFAIVPAAYGLQLQQRWGLGLLYELPVSLREVIVASVITLVLATALYRYTGIVTLAVCVVAILIIRVVVSRRLGGVSGYTLAGASAIAELVTLATFVTLPR